MGVNITGVSNFGPKFWHDCVEAMRNEDFEKCKIKKVFALLMPL